MAKEKVTITLDRSKADSARSLLGASSTSETIDLALDHIIHTERLRHDVAAYRRVPLTDDEVQFALLVATSDLEDETDWEALYPENQP